MLACLAICLIPAQAFAGQTVIANSDITLYSAPNQGHAVGTIAAGTKMTMTQVQGTWCQVHSGGTFGWCPSGLVSKASTARTGSRVNIVSGQPVNPQQSTVINAPQQNPALKTEAQAAPALPAGYGLCTASILNVRRSPELSAPIVTKIAQGTRMKLIDQSDGWYKIQIDEGFGWVKAEYIAAGTAQQTPAQVYQPKTGTSDYLIWINLSTQVGTVLSKDDEGNYSVIERTFGVSTGLIGPTPAGRFSIYEMYRWKYMHEDCFTQYAMRIYQGIMLHSEPYYTANPSSMMTGGYNKLGSPASEGCIRMRIVDAKWIYDNCGMGTIVEVTNGGYMQGVPSSITYEKLPYTVTWDPTDPDPENPYYGKYNKTYVIW